MKLRRRHRNAKSESDREYLIESNNTEHDHSKIRRLIWKFAKGTWKAFKIGLKTTVTSQCVPLEPTAIATTIVEYQTRRREYYS